MSDTIVWISGATEGVGLGLAQTVPYPGARIINLSRRQHPDYETVLFDLTRPETYAAVAESFRRELAGFSGKRAIFIHNAFYHSMGYVAEVDAQEYARAIQANAAAPQILGKMFLEAVQPGYEAGLVMISSAAARFPYAGSASYCAAKAAVEMWVRSVRMEIAERAPDIWSVAVRPGFVDTPGTRLAATLPHDVYPAGPLVAKQLAEGGPGVLTPEAAAREIWAALPPPPDKALLFFGQMVAANA